MAMARAAVGGDAMPRTAGRATPRSGWTAPGDSIRQAGGTCESPKGGNTGSGVQTGLAWLASGASLCGTVDGSAETRSSKRATILRCASLQTEHVPLVARVKEPHQQTKKTSGTD
ncbi:hypothetical protein U9M48_005448 [Paspalum notatum var. saurae]|uniref:Uncharacterized protein n=1 Tax=Paspalum notatum var. saurae TaxID=547442 RepID=A0AAQ3PQ91_PASNO